ncbi:MAG: FGGY-family carbohydrate kinase [Eubacteriales bacterium]
MKYLMGVDSGGTVTKAGIFDLCGKEIAIARKKFDIILPGDGKVERDINQFKNASLDAIKEVIEQSGINPTDIAGIALTGQGNGMYMFDERGEPTYNGILSGDMRAKEYIKRWNTDGTLDRILPKTKQILWSGQTTALVAWFADHEKEALEKTKTIVTCKDYIRYLLTGKFCMDLTQASGFSAMDLDTRKLDPEIFNALGILEHMDKFPSEIYKSCDVCGHVTGEASARTGLLKGTPVMGGMFDIAACAIASGVVDESILCLIIGTWGINEYVSKKPVVSKDMFMSTHYCIDGYYLMDEGSATSASNLDWFIDRFMTDGSKQNFVYDEVNSLIESVPYNDSTLLFFPLLYGTNVNIDAKAGFIGLSARHTKAHMLRAIYEGVVFCHMHHIEKLYKFRDKPEIVRISGGGTKSGLWVQMFADCLGLPVEVSEANEMGVMGSAMCAGVGVGLFADMKDAVNAFVRISQVYQPKEERRNYYQKKYKAYKKFLEALDGVWKELADIKKD